MLLRKHLHPIIPAKQYSLYYLSGRMSLPVSAEKEWERMKKGYLGELAFHRMIKSAFPINHLSLYSLTLQHDNRFFQIDHLIIFHDTIYIYEIKYFASDYVIRNNKWFSLKSDREISNPFIQLKRTETNVCQLLQTSSFSKKVIGKVVFMQEEFALFQASPQLPMVLPGQVRRYVNELALREQPPGPDGMDLARWLANRHIEEHPFDQLPDYSFDRLRKGMNCPRCMGMMECVSTRSLGCKSCQGILTNKKSNQI